MTPSSTLTRAPAATSAPERRASRFDRSAASPSAPAPARRGATAGSGVRFQLKRKPRKVVLTAHVLTSVGWFGTAVMVAFLLIMAGATSDPAQAAAFYRAVEASVWLSVPIGLLSAATGVVLGLGTKWGVARHWWVLAKAIAAPVVIITDLVLVAPGAHDALAGRLSQAPYGPVVAHCVILAAATVISIFKPGGRTPFHRRPPTIDA